MALVDVATDASGVVVVTFNDPERRNAMTNQMGAALQAAVTDVRTDPNVRVVILTGAPPAFSAGGDLDMLAETSRRAREEGVDPGMRVFYDQFLAVRELEVPTIAAVNGHAVGAGLCVALVCDLMIVAEEARVGLNFARLGLHPGMGGSWLLPARVGRQHAAHLLFTGDLVSGRDAAAMGMALEAVPANDVMARAQAIAERIATAAPGVIRQLVDTLRRTDETLDERLDREAAAQAVNFASDELVEGLSAIRERRPPRF
ncbi:MAG: enoyl-CoA hydratase-related protein [Nitriliruptorales bacterium]|nr:enoyl-CoA hydratase-related protein [Nitriliruptorales bacterium]